MDISKLNRDELTLLGAGACTMATLHFSSQLASQHLYYWKTPKEQRAILIIILMAPVYAVNSFVSVLDIKGSKPFFMLLNSIKECYEALVIAMFLSLLYTYLNISVAQNIVPDEIKGREMHHSFPMTLFQGVFIDILAKVGVIKSHHFWLDVEHVEEAIRNVLICVEMLLFSVFQQYAFHFEPYSGAVQSMLQKGKKNQVMQHGLEMVFGYAYPAYECFKSVEKNKPDIEQLRFWCQYWILGSGSGTHLFHGSRCTEKQSWHFTYTRGTPKQRGQYMFMIPSLDRCLYSCVLGFLRYSAVDVLGSGYMEPHSFTQASKDVKWIEAMNEEIQALEQNKTWILTLLPLGKTPIGNKWVYKIKFHVDVAKIVTVRTLLALAVTQGWHIEQLDINNAFLHGDLHEEVYMTVPQGYNQNLPPNTVCKLTKSLYGLKQANRQWFEKLTTFLIQLGFKQSYVDTSLFTISHKGSLTSLLIYVDDIVLTSPYASFITFIKAKLHDMFSIKDLGPLNYYLGIEFLRNKTGLAMSQRKYALELLEHAGVLNVKPSAIPIDPIVKLDTTDGEPLLDPIKYRTLVVVSRSSTEAEYRALADSTCEISWLKYLLHDLHEEIPTPTLMMCDNASTIALANNPIHHARTKHIEIDCHFVRDKIKQGQIQPCFISTKSQIADILTKGLCRFLHCNCLSKLGICDPYSMPTCV
ncbi:retrovirus-related pol polyprotein from transposon RE1 [Tanacetum coccineum]